ncbi:unnamed protein product, partial [marine sediment metagenome]
NNLRDYHKNDVNVGIDVLRDEILAVITATVDDAGVRVEFDLTTPAADIIVNAGELATFNSITFP